MTQGNSIKIRPKRLLVGIAVGTAIVLGLNLVIDQSIHRYHIWKAGGTWCATLHADGSVTRYYGDEACGY
jgi:hypothetical protein